MEQDTTPLYRKTPRANYSNVYAPVYTTQRFEAATDWIAIKNGDSSKTTHHPWLFPIDKKHTFLHAESEDRLNNTRGGDPYKNGGVSIGQHIYHAAVGD